MGARVDELVRRLNELHERMMRGDEAALQEAKRFAPDRSSSTAEEIKYVERMSLMCPGLGI